MIPNRQALQSPYEGCLQGECRAGDFQRRAPFPPEYNVADYVRRAALKRELLVREIGPDVIFMAPPLIITQQEVGLLLQRLKDTLAETEAWLAAKA